MGRFFSKIYTCFKKKIQQPIIKSSNTAIKRLEDIPTTGFNASEVGANYTRLANYLKAKNFLAADIETARIMLWVAQREEEDWLRKKDIEKFPCRDLRTINELWLASSGGKFGFSVQKQIWIKCGGKDYRYDEHETIMQSCEKFLECVQWKVGGKWVWELSHEKHWWEDRILQWTWENVLNEQWRRGIEWSWYQMGLPFAGNFGYLTWNLRAVRGHLPITIHNLVGWSGLKIVDEGSYDPTTKDPKTEDSTTSPRTGKPIMEIHVPEDHYCHFLSDGFLSHAATCKL
ncbi:MAG: GUN4 domain-containing protein [Bacteroidota bacterium]